jgi:hypothetical protein
VNTVLICVPSAKVLVAEFVVTLISWGLVQIAMSPGTPEFVKALSVKYEMTLTLGEMSCGRTNINALPTFVIRTPCAEDEGALPLVEVENNSAEVVLLE